MVQNKKLTRLAREISELDTTDFNYVLDEIEKIRYSNNCKIELNFSREVKE